MKIRFFRFYPEFNPYHFSIDCQLYSLHYLLQLEKLSPWWLGWAEHNRSCSEATVPELHLILHQHVPTHINTVSPTHTTPCTEPGHTLPHTAQSLPLADRGSSSPIRGFYLWCQTTKRWSSAAGRPHPRSQPPCRSPWQWNCRRAHRRAVGGSREEVDGSTQCAGELWRTSEGGRCLSLWSDERGMLD